MADQTYTVVKAQTDGAKDYARGDSRAMSETDAKPLVDMGALKAKAERKPEPKPAKNK